MYVSIPKVLKRAAKAMVAQSDRWPRIFIRELKRMDRGMPTLMTELLSHSESFDEFAESLHSNENKSAKKMAKAMNRHYLDYLNELGILENKNESVSEPMDVRLKPEPKEPQDEQFPGQSMPGMAGPSMAGPTASMGSMGGLQGGPFGGGGSAMAGGSAAPKSGEYPGAMNFPGTENKKEFGYHHLIKEMGSYDNMKNAMMEYLDT